MITRMVNLETWIEIMDRRLLGTGLDLLYTLYTMYITAGRWTNHSSVAL